MNMSITSHLATVTHDIAETASQYFNSGWIGDTVIQATDYSTAADQ